MVESFGRRQFLQAAAVLGGTVAIGALKPARAAAMPANLLLSTTGSRISFGA